MKRFALSVLFLTFAILGLSAQIFYKIEGNGLTSPSYILGTHHLSPLSIIDSIPGCREALQQSQQVIGEIDMTQDPMAMAMQMQPYMLAPADSTLSKILSKEDYDRINSEFKKFSPVPGVDLSAFENMRPMVINALVTVALCKNLMPDYKEGEQLDTYFQIEAKNTGKKVIGLETPKFQASLLYATEPISYQVKELMDILDNPEEAVNVMSRLNKAYLSQDMEEMMKLSEEDPTSNAFKEALINCRNMTWLSLLPDMIKAAPSFIAVGALHLPGQHGIIEGLRNAGFTLTPIR